MSHSHLSLNDRINIKVMLELGKKKSEIALKLNRSKSTISDEIKRNSNVDGDYDPDLAQKKYNERKSNCGAKYKLLSNNLLRNKIIDGLKNKWSPEQICGRLKYESKIPECLSFKTIYNSLYKGLLPEVCVFEVLRHKSKKRKKRGEYLDGRGQIVDRKVIDLRPKSCDDRSEHGHIEIDTVIGKNRKGAIVTCVDRKSRYTWAGLLENRRSCNLTAKVIEIFGNNKYEIVKTITADNGKEFAKFKEIELGLNCEFYFAHPYHSWERGTNENTNGLLREYFPKKTNFLKISEDELDQAVYKLNNRPRKILGFKTPQEVFDDNFKVCSD